MDWQSLVLDIVRRWVPDPQVSEAVRVHLSDDGARFESERRLRFRAFRERSPGPLLRRLFEEFWPDYRRWYLREGLDARPTLAEARRALGNHMPELLPVWARIVNAVDTEELGARMLSMYDPPPLMSGCSQAALSVNGHHVLIRNYDYDPELFDELVLQTQLTGRGVIGTSDQLWGLLDGINDAGLAASFTFGGRRTIGRGFSMPIVIRYVLEICNTVDEAVSVLPGLPVQAAYNVTLLDRSGDHATVFLVPERSATVTRDRATTNHQRRVHWPAHARWTRSIERLDRLNAALESRSARAEDVIATMLRPPLRATAWAQGFATLYTAAYRSADGSVEYRWPGSAWHQSFADFREGVHEVSIGGRPAEPAAA